MRKCFMVLKNFDSNRVAMCTWLCVCASYVSVSGEVTMCRANVIVIISKRKECVGWMVVIMMTKHSIHDVLVIFGWFKQWILTIHATNLACGISAFYARHLRTLSPLCYCSAAWKLAFLIWRDLHLNYYPASKYYVLQRWYSTYWYHEWWKVHLSCDFDGISKIKRLDCDNCC